MDRVIGLIGLAVYIVAIVGLAAAITFAVIKIFPTERTPKKPDGTAPSPPEGGVAAGAGRLFRKAKREAT